MTQQIKILAALAGLNLAGCAATIQVPAEQSLERVVGEMNQSSADVTLRSGRTFDADSAYLRDDHLTVWEDGISHDVLRDSLARISVHTIGAGIGSGMGTGFLTGAAFGVMMGVATGSSMNADDGDPDYVALGTVGGLAFGLAGAVIGGIVGGIAGAVDVSEYQFKQSASVKPDPSWSQEVNVVPGLVSEDEISMATIIVPALESEDATAVVFYWNGKLERLPKARITTEEVPEGIAISMPQSLRGTLK